MGKPQFRKGTHCTYKAWASQGATITAIVRTVHKDGTFTVEARHILDKDGQISGCYLGYKYRMARCDLIPQPDGVA